MFSRRGAYRPRRRVIRPGAPDLHVYTWGAGNDGTPKMSNKAVFDAIFAKSRYLQSAIFAKNHATFKKSAQRCSKVGASQTRQATRIAYFCAENVRKNARKYVKCAKIPALFFAHFYIFPAQFALLAGFTRKSRRQSYTTACPKSLENPRVRSREQNRRKPVAGLKLRKEIASSRAKLRKVTAITSASCHRSYGKKPATPPCRHVEPSKNLKMAKVG